MNSKVVRVEPRHLFSMITVGNVTPLIIIYFIHYDLSLSFSLPIHVSVCLSVFLYVDIITFSFLCLVIASVSL